MSQKFKLKFEEMRNGNPTDSEGEKSQYKSYASNSHVRNLCFEWPDGKMKFLNYAYLISGEFNPDNSTIKLIFTSDTILLTGSNLGELFLDLLNHTPQMISCTDTRYSPLQGTDDVIVSEIQITSTG